MDEVFTVKELASYLKVKPVTIYKLCGRKQIPAVKIASFWRFQKHSIDQWMEDKSYGKEKRKEGIEKERTEGTKGREEYKKGTKGFRFYFE